MKNIIFLLLISINCFAQEFKNKFPVETQTLNHKYYTINYSDKYKQAICSDYKLTKDMVVDNTERENKFKVDVLVKGTRIKPTNYLKSGYDKGHLAPASHFNWNQDAMNESFLMSNICPQLPNFNRGIWKELEHMNKLWVDEKKELYVYTGPIFESNCKKFSKDSISVPTAFYKIIIRKVNSKYECISFIIPHKEYHKDAKLLDYVVTIDDIEELTQIDFFYNLSDGTEIPLEKRKLVGTWLFY